MHDLPALPSVESPARISPTQAFVASRCLLRFVLGKRLDGGPDLPSSSPLKYVGKAFHAVIEAARKGEAGDPPDRLGLADVWRSALATAEVEALESGDQDWVPLAKHVSGLERTRLRAIQIAQTQTVRVGGGFGLGRTETWLESRDKTVGGRVDAIDRSGGAVFLRDYKSGDVLDAGGMPKPEYVTQMHMYARLYFEVEGSWPDHLELVDRYGRLRSVSFTPDAANGEYDRAREILGRARTAVGEAGAISTTYARGIATADEDVCGTCPHRPSCPLHMDRLAETGILRFGASRFGSLDVQGSVSRVQANKDGRVQLGLLCGDREVSVGSFTPEGNFCDPAGDSPRTPEPKQGDVIAVFGVAPIRPLDTMGDSIRLVVVPGARSFVVSRRSGA